jgi:hypothetical protein
LVLRRDAKLGRTPDSPRPVGYGPVVALLQAKWCHARMVSQETFEAMLVGRADHIVRGWGFPRGLSSRSCPDYSMRS